MVPGEFPSPRTPHIDRYAEGDVIGHVSDTASLRSAPGSLQHASFDRAASPRMSGSLPQVPEGPAVSPSSPLTSIAREESVSHGAHAERTGTGDVSHVTQYGESPVKAEPDPEGPWLTVRRDGRHSRSVSRTSTNQTGRDLGGPAPLSEEVLTSVHRAEEGMTPRERAAYHDRMRREYERQERERLEHLRQLEEDAWVAEQLSRTPEPSQGSAPAGNSNHGRATYEEPRRDASYGLQRGNQEPLEATNPMAVPVGRDDRDERISALEHQLDVMARAMERFSIAQFNEHGRSDLVAQVVPVASTNNNNVVNVPKSTPNLESASKKAKKEKQRAKNSLLPSAQLEPSSFLGKILSSGGGPPGDDSSSSSDSSDPRGPDGSEDGSESSSEDRGHKPKLKPVNPDKYDGREDAEAFHKYVRQISLGIV